jgi:hypothetical protein
MLKKKWEKSAQMADNTELYGAMNLQLFYNFCRQKYADFCQDMPNNHKKQKCSKPHG